MIIGDDGIDWDNAAILAQSDTVFTDSNWFSYFTDLVSFPCTCLDLGCNIGKWYKAFDNLGVKYEGCDFSEVAINIARSRYPSVQFYLMRAEEMEFEDKYDLIFSHTMLQHTNLNTKELLMPRIWKALKNGGIFVIEEKCDVDTITTFTHENWIKYITRFGFRFIRMAEDRDGFVFQKQVRNEVTLAVLAKDDNYFLSQCLHYHKPFFQHILVLASDDMAGAIAERYGAIVYYETEAMTGFDVKRNYLAAQCSTPWVIFIDCDELFDWNFLNNISSYVAVDSVARKLDVIAFKFPRINLDNEHPVDYHLRLYQIDKCEWYGEVHEILVVKGTQERVDEFKLNSGKEICQILDGHNIIHLRRPPEQRERQRRRWSELSKNDSNNDL